MMEEVIIKAEEFFKFERNENLNQSKNQEEKYIRVNQIFDFISEK